MTLGGRPKERGGHKGIKISVDRDIEELLRGIRAHQKNPNASKFVEDLLRPFQDVTLGPPLGVLSEIHTKLIAEAYRAGKRGDLEGSSALTHIAFLLRPWIDLGRSGISRITLTASPTAGRSRLTSHFVGRARDDHGNPVSGAKLYLLARTIGEEDSGAIGALISEFMTDEEGRFDTSYTFRLPKGCVEEVWRVYVSDNPQGL